MMRFYFAHPVTDYGTPWERQAVDAIKRVFGPCEVVNPNRPDWQDAYKRFGMQFFIERCDECEHVVWAPFPDGSVGAGVWQEVQSFADRARETPKSRSLIFKINRGHTITNETPPAPLTVEQTRALIASIGRAA